MKHLAILIALIGIGSVSISGNIVPATEDPFDSENGKYYLGTSERVSWFMAYYQCKQLGMELISIKSPEEQNEIKQLIKDSGFRNANFWTSGMRGGEKKPTRRFGIYFDEDQQNEFYWMKNGEPFIYTDWTSNEPNGEIADGSMERCVDLRASKDFSWTDRLCNNKLFFVCEREQSKKEISVENQKYYVGTAQKVDWFTANRQCKNLGMDLISIDTHEKDDEILELIKRIGFDSFDFWTSGTIQGDYYHWMGNGNKITYTNWYEDQPDATLQNGVTEKCIELRGEFKLKWNDRICSDKDYFICE